jgi:uncharacterized protein with von Willebrand factor type A (vWA) domain
MPVIRIQKFIIRQAGNAATWRGFCTYDILKDAGWSAQSSAVCPQVVANKEATISGMKQTRETARSVLIRRPKPNGLFPKTY